VTAAGADDDLELLSTIADAAAPGEPAHEPVRDRLVAGPGPDVYLARASDRAVLAVPKAGGAPRVLARLDEPASALAVGGGALWIGSRHAILKLPLADGGAPAVVARGLAGPRSVASDGTWTFVVDVDASRGGMLPRSTIVRLPADGGPPAVVGRATGDVEDVALGDANVYWADALEGTIVAAPEAGGEPRAIATERGLPGEVVVAGGDLYWVERRSESVWTMPAAGGAPRRMTQDFAGFADLVADARGVSWRTEAAVDGAFRVLTAPRAGGDAVPASVAARGIDALAGDGEHLYWSRDGVVSRVLAPSD